MGGFVPGSGHAPGEDDVDQADQGCDAHVGGDGGQSGETKGFRDGQDDVDVVHENVTDVFEVGSVAVFGSEYGGPNDVANDGGDEECEGCRAFPTEQSESEDPGMHRLFEGGAVGVVVGGECRRIGNVGVEGKGESEQIPTPGSKGKHGFNSRNAIGDDTQATALLVAGTLLPAWTETDEIKGGSPNEQGDRGSNVTQAHE